MPGPFRHEALPYPGAAGFADACAGVVREGLADGDRSLVLATQARLDELRDVLGPDAAGVALVPVDAHGRNPARLTTLLDTFRLADPRPCLGVQEAVLATWSPAARAEAELAQYALNGAALADWSLTLVCLYDDTALDDGGRLAMRGSHAVVRGFDANPDFRVDAGDTARRAPLDPPPADARLLGVAGPLDLATLRAFVRTAGEDAGLAPDRLEDLVLAANELVTNSLRHGGGRADVLAWQDDAGVVCEVRDPGRFDDPLAGRLTPPRSAMGGRGLWLVQQVCDLVRLRATDAGTVVRVHLDRA